MDFIKSGTIVEYLGDSYIIGAINFAYDDMISSSVDLKSSGDMPSKEVSISEFLRCGRVIAEPAQKPKSQNGEALDTILPISMVGIDHTLLDACIIDERTHNLIGRPWLTLALDLHSRFVVGMHLSMDKPNNGEGKQSHTNIRYNGIVERFIAYLNNRLISYLCDMTGNSLSEWGEENSEKSAWFSLDGLRDIIDCYINDIYHFEVYENKHVF
jgi:hypothetical protein